MKEVLVYQMVMQLPLAANRSQRRQIEKEYNMIVEKLNRIVLDYNHIITYQNAHDNMDLFHHYNEKYQHFADLLGVKLKFHAIHRGWFSLMYKPERIGVKRDEERNTNAFSNWTMETIATPFLFKG